ncbi:MAG TPA: hypothetical protein VIV08_05505 [Acidimicrobiia bacterium]
MTAGTGAAPAVARSSVVKERAGPGGRQRSHGSGSRYSAPTRTEKCTASIPLSTPEVPMRVCGATGAPTPTATEPRYEYDVRRPPP